LYVRRADAPVPEALGSDALNGVVSVDQIAEHGCRVVTKTTGPCYRLDSRPQAQVADRVGGTDWAASSQSVAQAAMTGSATPAGAMSMRLREEKPIVMTGPPNF
jgi:hypothetical protein